MLFTSVKHMTIVPASNWLSEIVGESFLGRYPRRVIHNGIDLKMFAPQDQRPDIVNKLNIGDRFMILGVANTWGSTKGLGDFLQLRDVISPHDVIVLVGLNRSEMRRLPGNIIGLARTESQEQLSALYGAAGVYVNPTLVDTFPSTNIEALACGTPVITYRTGGSVEAVSADTGLVIDKGDIAGLHNAVEAVKSRGKARFSEACRERAVRLYNRDERYAEYVDLYEEATSPAVCPSEPASER
jgi:glycosyltransferase involved in cell wall biosynthesis